MVRCRWLGLLLFADDDNLAVALDGNCCDDRLPPLPFVARYGLLDNCGID